MKLTAILVACSMLAVEAFGVSPNPSVTKKVLNKPAFTNSINKDSAAGSPLFRDPSLTRGGAVPGWQAYNDSLDNNPLITKAMTSLVGWAAGDFLAQVRVLLCPVLVIEHKGLLICGKASLVSCF